MEMFRIEYMRKNNRNRGKKKGVLYCGISTIDSANVDVGFSVCNTIDRFDYIDRKPCKGFGLDLAKQRAEKWSLFTEFFVQKSWTEDRIMDETEELLLFKNPNTQQVVEIPPSVVAPLKRFIERCRKYYKDREFPEWVRKIENDEPYPTEELETVTVRQCIELDIDL